MKLKQNEIKNITDVLKAIGHPIRIEILIALKKRPLIVNEVKDLIGTTTANISQHLSQLERAGLVEKNKSQNYVFSEIAEGKKEIIFNTLKSLKNF